MQSDLGVHYSDMLEDTLHVARKVLRCSLSGFVAFPLMAYRLTAISLMVRWCDWIIPLFDKPVLHCISILGKIFLQTTFLALCCLLFCFLLFFCLFVFFFLFFVGFFGFFFFFFFFFVVFLFVFSSSRRYAFTDHANCLLRKQFAGNVKIISENIQEMPQS